MTTQNPGPLATNLGFPRIGPDRELKWALEGYWAGELDGDDLTRRARELRLRNWRLQEKMGLDHIPSNDFSLYDHVLDTAVLVGAVPDRYGWRGEEPVDLDTYFAMARGGPAGGGDRGAGESVRAMEMTKWFDTNYHYIVPEFEADQTFRPGSTKPIDEFVEARDAGIRTRPVLLGPVSFLLLGRTTEDSVRPLDLLDRLLPVYEEVLRRLGAAGADWVQIDEPCLVLDLPDGAGEAYEETYGRLAGTAPSLDLLLATYFGELRENLELALSLPVEALHLDLVRAPGQLEPALDLLPNDMALSLGVVDGRNVWRSDLEETLRRARGAARTLGEERILIGPSASLLHVPVDLEMETELPADIRSWLAFAKQKVEEIVTLTRVLGEGEEAVAGAVAESRSTRIARESSTRVHSAPVLERLEGFAFTEHGWVQSYGSRCVRPPVLYGDVSRPEPMSVRWITYARSCTERPVKGILTGPVTMLQWSFVRDDQRRPETCRQLALAIRDEVLDLEEAGTEIIQIDEPALREGLPLRRDGWEGYLEWAVGAFRLAASGVDDETQIHTHMCYSDFNDIIEAIGDMDADVLYIEAARSRMQLLDAFSDYRYPNDIGPGVYDIHSPRIPSDDEMEELLQAARKRLSPDQIWVNPDCGLKTRRWEEVVPSLANMVEAAERMREAETGRSG